MLTRIRTASLFGMEGEPVCAEVDLLRGLPAFDIVGLPGTAIREAHLRIRGAMENSEVAYPSRRITVNLTPAARRKEGTHFDLPIAVGILAAAGEVGLGAWEEAGFFGELSLDGGLVGVRGALSLVLCAKEEGIRRVVVPRDNWAEVAMVKDMEIYPCRSLREVLRLLGGEAVPPASPPPPGDEEAAGPDFREVIGQEAVKRALIISAAGAHGVLMVGNPGCGKSMLAERLAGILPPMSRDEQLEVTRVYSVAGLLDKERPWIRQRPFRSPHHTITKTALLGGGQTPRPGEFSLAHYGVLFLDELGEFDRSVLNGLRQPLENDEVTVVRHNGRATFPGKVILVAASNPCPCGHLGDPRRRCQCTPGEIQRYRHKLSGPLLDRIDMHLEVPQVAYGEGEEGMSSTTMRAAVMRGRRCQEERFCGVPIYFNAQIGPADLERYCPLDGEARELLRTASHAMGLSMRGVHRTIRLARTIADLEEAEVITEAHMAEALRYRPRE